MNEIALAEKIDQMRFIEHLLCQIYGGQLRWTILKNKLPCITAQEMKFSIKDFFSK